MSYETVPTEFVEAEGIRFAYRRAGANSGVPLLLLQHFSGTMDGWDPSVVNGLAHGRRVIVFDNTGVGQSSGQTPDNVRQMAIDAERFIRALGLDQVDLLGYSLGGMVAQQLATTHSGRVRKLILVGTAPQGGEEHLLKVLADASAQHGLSDPRLHLFFTQSAASQAAGRAFLERTKLRTLDRDPDSGKNVMDPQAHALIAWCATQDPGNSLLRAIRQPALVVNGSSDAMLPANNSYLMFKHLQFAQLALYPDAAHGSLFQYPQMFVDHAAQFLDGSYGGRYAL